MLICTIKLDHRNSVTTTAAVSKEMVVRAGSNQAYAEAISDPLKKNCDQSQPNSRELLRDFERVSYNFKDLQRVLHNWEPKLKSVGGAVMEHRGVLESVLPEIAKLQYLFTKTWQALEVSQGQVAA